jgi:glucose/arabinose dehydrogenase
MRFLFLRALCPSFLALIAATLALTVRATAAQPRDPARLSAELCVGCHGPNLNGGVAPSLLDSQWKSGSDDASILRSIRDGFPQANMPPYAAVLSDEEQRAMLAYIRRLGRQLALGLIPASVQHPASVTLKSERHTFKLETFAAPLDTPWGIVFLPDGQMVVSDRIGSLRVIKDGVVHPEPIRGTPKPFVRQDGGFLDLIAHPDFAQNGWLYLAYTEAGKAPRSTMTVVVRGRIQDGTWVEESDIFRAAQEFYSIDDYSHYGCRFLFDRAGHLFFTIGDRGRAHEAQDLRSPLGKIHRVFDDGRIPPDNPFVHQPGACASVWSYGHRHVQGLQFHPVSGALWATEHGPRGGDELNVIKRGHNYGWPVISHGQAQSREKIEDTAREGMEQPAAWWTPSIAPAAIEFYSGAKFPQWNNNLFLASLIGRQLRRIETQGDKVVHQEVLFSDMGRVRDVVVGPDGLLYLALNTPGRIARLVPVEEPSASK